MTHSLMFSLFNQQGASFELLSLYFITSQFLCFQNGLFFILFPSLIWTSCATLKETKEETPMIPSTFSSALAPETPVMSKEKGQQRGTVTAYSPVPASYFFICLL